MKARLNPWYTMGIHVSKPKVKTTLLRRKRRTKGTKDKTSPADHAHARRKYVSGWAILAKPWEIVCEEPAEKWKRAKGELRQFT